MILIHFFITKMNTSKIEFPENNDEKIKVIETKKNMNLQIIEMLKRKIQEVTEDLQKNIKTLEYENNKLSQEQASLIAPESAEYESSFNCSESRYHKDWFIDDDVEIVN